MQTKGNKILKRYLTKRSKLVFFLLFSFFFSLASYSHCAMCRAALESEEGGVKAEGINDGIVYLMIVITSYSIHYTKLYDIEQLNFHHHQNPEMLF